MEREVRFSIKLCSFHVLLGCFVHNRSVEVRESINYLEIFHSAFCPKSRTVWRDQAIWLIHQHDGPPTYCLQGDTLRASLHNEWVKSRQTANMLKQTEDEFHRHKVFTKSIELFSSLGICALASLTSRIGKIRCAIWIIIFSPRFGIQ